MKLAIIPARSGSKRIPQKNSRLFFNKPMIAWPIIEVIQSGFFDKVIVSTDCQHIAEIAASYGAEVPFLRPHHLSDDYTPTIPVIAHGIEAAEHYYKCQFNDVCCIYATAPLLYAADLMQAHQLFSDLSAAYVFSVVKYPFPIQRSLKLNALGQVAMNSPDMFNVRSQDLEVMYHDAAQFYWGRRDAWLNGEKIFGSNSYGHVLPRYRVQDIDDLEDWTQAEHLFRLLKS